MTGVRALHLVNTFGREKSMRREVVFGFAACVMVCLLANCSDLDGGHDYSPQDRSRMDLLSLEMRIDTVEHYFTEPYSIRLYHDSALKKLDERTEALEEAIEELEDDVDDLESYLWDISSRLEAIEELLDINPRDG